MVKYILLALTGYFIFRFVTGFLLPVIRTTRLAKKQFEQMQAHMQQHMQQGEAGFSTSANPPKEEKSATSPKMGEYIPFEEIK